MCRRQEFHLTIAAKDYINDKLLSDKWSPMIISKHLESAGFDTISHTYIYSYIRKDKESGGELYKSLANPIEKVWANFKNKLRRIRHLYTSFKEAVTAAWNSMKTLSG